MKQSIDGEVGTTDRRAPPHVTSRKSSGYLFSMAHYRLALVESLAFFGASCDVLGFAEVCTLELRPRYSPVDTTIQIGESFQASVELLTCGGKKQVADVFTWHAEDPVIASVDEQTGRVVGQGPGATRVFAKGQRHGAIGGIQVSVEGPGP